MMPTTLLLAAVSLALPQTRIGRGPAHWHYEAYARQLGQQHYPGGNAALDDEIAAVEALPSGAVLVAGSTFGSLGEAHAGSAGTSDAFLARFDPVGNLEWVRQIGAVTGPTIPALNGNPSGPGGVATGSDGALDIAVAADGSILMTGVTSGNLGETNAGSGDVFLAKFTARGALLWLRQLGAETAPTLVPEPGATLYGDASRWEYGLSIACTTDSGAVVGGLTLSNLTEECTTYQDFVVLRYDPAGQLAWVRQMGSASAPKIGYAPQHSPIDEISQVVIHPSGRILLAGYAYGAAGTVVFETPVLMAFDSAGVPLQWVANAGSSLSAIQVHAPTGRILVAGASTLSDRYTYVSRIMAASYAADLNLEWTTVIDPALAAQLGLGGVGTERVADLRLDPLGNLVVAGTTWGSLDELPGGRNDIFAARFRGTDGAVLSVSQLGLATAGFGFDTTEWDSVGENGLALGPAGTILVGGWTIGDFGETHAGGRDALLLRLDPYGKLR